MTRQFQGTDSELARWWREQTEDDIAKTVPKAIEYGAQDLLDMGRDAAGILGREGVSDEEAMEIAIWFYLRGKLARWTAAIRRGDRVSDDTVFDVGIYARMVQRIREVGSWPGDFAEQIEGKVPLPDESNSVRASIGLDYSEVSDFVDPESVRAFEEPPAVKPVINIEVTGPPDGTEIAGAIVRVEAMRAVHEFRNRLKKSGFREFNSVGELYHDELDLKVSTQYESMGDWRVKIWHGRTLTVNEFIPRDKARSTLQGLEAIEWRSAK
jgi:hypothetical protein